MSFGEALRRLRTVAGLTQEEVAERSGLSVRAISDMERGRSRRPYRDSVRRLAEALELSAEAADQLGMAARPARTLAPPEPIAKTGVAPAQLPLDIGGFVGRADDLAFLDQVGSGSRAGTVIAITGAAGIGKTALAVHWAHRMRDRFPDGQIYLNLRGFGPDAPVDVAEALARLLRSTGTAGDALPKNVDERAAVLRTQLADRRMLIILDNARDAEQVRPLLPGTNSVVLVTSRNQLRGLVSRDGARRIGLRRLPIGDAVAVLTMGLDPTRIRSEPASYTEMAEVCDRLPLALRVAAERISRFDEASVAELAGSLRRERALLQADESATDLAAVFSWSYRALDDDAAAVFRLLGLHPSGEISLPAAAALAGRTTVEARGLLDRLVNVHLLQQNAPDRYELHDLLHSYAAAQVAVLTAADDRAAAVQRMVEWYLHTADNARKRIQVGGRDDVLDPPHTQVVASTFDSVTSAFEWQERHFSTMAALVRFTTEHGPHRFAWQLAWVLSAYLFANGDANSYVAIGTLMLSASEHVDDPRARAQAHHMLGIALTQSHRLIEAIEHFHRALAFYRQLQDRVGEVKCLYSLGMAYTENKQIRAALETLETAIAVTSPAESALDHAISLLNLGSLYIEEQRFAEGSHYTDQAIVEFHRQGYLFGEATAYVNLAEARAGLSDHRGAGKAWRTAFALLGRTNSWMKQADLLISVGTILRDQNRLISARHAWVGAERIFGEHSDHSGLSRVQRLLE